MGLIIFVFKFDINMDARDVQENIFFFVFVATKFRWLFLHIMILIIHRKTILNY